MGKRTHYEQEKNFFQSNFDFNSVKLNFYGIFLNCRKEIFFDFIDHLYYLGYSQKSIT